MAILCVAGCSSGARSTGSPLAVVPAARPAGGADPARVAQLFVDSPTSGGPAATIQLVARGCSIRASASLADPVTVPVGSEGSIQAWASGAAQEMAFDEVRLLVTLCPGKTYVVQADATCQLHIDGPSRCDR